MSQVLNSMLGWPGAFIMRRIDYLVNLTTFVCFVLRDWFMRVGLIYRYGYRPLVTQIIFSGVDALPSVVFLGFMTGFILTFRMIDLFDSVGDTVAMLQYMIGLEIGPLMAAIILISRTASAITVDIGNMKLHKEIQSLELMGVDINETLIAPRILGVTISQLVVAVYFTLVALGSGILLSGLLTSPDHFSYFFKLADSADPMMLLLFVIKNVLFGLTIGAVSCYHGLKVESSATEVPQQTQQAIVSILIMLFIIDSIIVMVLL